MTEFPNALEQLRELKGWTQQEMAEAIGMPRTAYNDGIKGRRNFTAEHMRKAAKATDTTFIVFFIDNRGLFIDNKTKGEKR